MQRAWVAFGGGALVGAVAGFLFAVLGELGKDLRDSRLRRAGIPVPSDRVFARYHWPFAAVGALQATVLVASANVATTWAVLSVLAFPACRAALLPIQWLFGLIPTRPRRESRLDIDPRVLVGMESGEAMKLLTDKRCRFHVLDEAWGLAQPIYRGGSPYVRLSVASAKVTRAEIVGE